MKLLCLGDSLTFGSVGYSYTKFLNKNYKVINKGINGDTTKCAYNRLYKYINSSKYDDVGIYIISIGTNDLYVPFLTSLSSSWKIEMEPAMILKKCIRDKELFAIEYEKYIKLILEHKKNIILIGLPIIQVTGFSNQSVIERNNVIRTLAEKYNVPFIDTTLLQTKILKKDQETYSWKYKDLMRVIDAIIMFVFPFTKDYFSKLRGLELTVDGVHFNSRSAKLIANEINNIIENKK